MKDIIDTFIKSLFFFLLFFSVLLTVSGCSSVAGYIGKSQDLRKEISSTEMAANVRALCATNYDVLVDRYGANPYEWNAINTVCFPNGKPLQAPLSK